MHWMKQNQLSGRFTQRQQELEQAYWYARTAQSRPGLYAAGQQRWRDLAERAARSLREMGVFIDG